MLETLRRPATWLTLALNLLVMLAVWEVGMSLARLVVGAWPARIRTSLRVVWTLAAVYVLLALTVNTLHAPLEPLATQGALVAEWFRASAGRTVAVLVLAVIAWNLVSLTASRIVPSGEFTRLSVRVQTLKSVVESSLRVGIVVIALLSVLDNLGVKTTTLLAGVSVLGLAVSFGAQSLVRDVIAGFFVLLEDQYGVGDVITVNSGPLNGTVERLNLRFTALRALDGTLHIVPNGQINTVSVLSKDWSRVVALVSFPPTADVDAAIGLLKRVSTDLYADPEWQPQFLEEPNVEGVTTLSKDGFEVRALFRVLPKAQWPVGREFNRRMKLTLDGAGLGGLRPQLTIVRQAEPPISGLDNSGQAPAKPEAAPGTGSSEPPARMV